MGEEIKNIKKDLKKINDLMKNVSKNWEKLDDDEFYKLAENYPNYLPSFEEFRVDFKEWIDKLEQNS